MGRTYCVEHKQKMNKTFTMLATEDNKVSCGMPSVTLERWHTIKSRKCLDPAGARKIDLERPRGSLRPGVDGDRLMKKMMKKRKIHRNIYELLLDCCHLLTLSLPLKKNYWKNVSHKYSVIKELYKEFRQRYGYLHMEGGHFINLKY